VDFVGGGDADHGSSIFIRNCAQHLLDEGVVFLPADDHDAESVQYLLGLFLRDKTVSKLGNYEVDKEGQF
jgi:hypothetical protein